MAVFDRYRQRYQLGATTIWVLHWPLLEPLLLKGTLPTGLTRLPSVPVPYVTAGSNFRTFERSSHWWVSNLQESGAIKSSKYLRSKNWSKVYHLKYVVTKKIDCFCKTNTKLTRKRYPPNYFAKRSLEQLTDRYQGCWTVGAGFGLDWCFGKLQDGWWLDSEQPKNGLQQGSSCKWRSVILDRKSSCSIEDSICWRLTGSLIYSKTVDNATANGVGCFHNTWKEYRLQRIVDVAMVKDITE